MPHPPLGDIIGKGLGDVKGDWGLVWKFHFLFTYKLVGELVCWCVGR